MNSFETNLFVKTIITYIKLQAIYIINYTIEDILFVSTLKIFISVFISMHYNLIT